jgi:hypothetical protein
MIEWKEHDHEDDELSAMGNQHTLVSLLDCRLLILSILEHVVPAPLVGHSSRLLSTRPTMIQCGWESIEDRSRGYLLHHWIIMTWTASEIIRRPKWIKLVNN